MTWTLWQWRPSLDDWEWVTEATEDMKRKIAARHRKHNPKGTRFSWTTGYKPKRFRTRRKM